MTRREGLRRSSRNGPTALRIILGVKLRRLRQDRDISREAAGRAIRGSHAKITRLERGQVGAKERDLRDLLTLYGIHDPDEREEFFDLARQANSPGWWCQYSDVLEDWFELHLGLEDAASVIRTYEVQFLPGLLQTEDYAYAVSKLGYPNTEPRKVARIVALRMARQGRLLHRPEPPPRLGAVVDEAVLRRPFGGTEVMREQLEHLLKMIELPHITLQVAPFEVTAAAAGTPGDAAALRGPRSARQGLSGASDQRRLSGQALGDRPVHADHGPAVRRGPAARRDGRLHRGHARRAALTWGGPGSSRYGGAMERLRVEFTTEPFDLDEAPEHAVVAREVVQSAALDAVDVGPFGNTAEGSADAVLGAVTALLRRSLEAGATRVSLQVNVLGEGED